MVLKGSQTYNLLITKTDWLSLIHGSASNTWKTHWSIKPLNKVRGSYSGYDCPARLQELKLWKLGHSCKHVIYCQLLVMVDFACPGRPTNLFHWIHPLLTSWWLLPLNHNYIKILESDWSSAALIWAVIVQLHASCACNCTVVCVMPE